MSTTELETITAKTGTDGTWTRVTGTDLAGDKRALDVSVNGTIGATPVGLGTAGKFAEVALNSSTWTALTAGLADRTQINIQNLSGTEIKLNFATPAGYTGIVLATGNERNYQIDDALTINGKSTSGTPTVNVEEIG